MTKDAGCDVRHAAVGVDQATVLVASDGIDRQVAAQQVVFKGDLGCGVAGEAGIARAGFSFGTRERVLLLRMWMQEHREVLAHGAKALCQHVGCGAADHDPVAVLDRQPEQGVAHCAAHYIALHQPYRSSSAMDSVSALAAASHSCMCLLASMVAR